MKKVIFEGRGIKVGHWSEVLEDGDDFEYIDIYFRLARKEEN